MGYVLGVDFGTSFTAAVAVSNGASRVVTLGKRAGAVPTATFLREDGTLIHGEDAYLVGAHDPDRLIRNLKRRLADPAPVQIGDRSYPVTELVSAYLRWVVEAAVMSEGGTPDRLLFTHPANWRSVRLELFRSCLTQAGLAEVSFAPEPFAAAAFHSVSGDVSVGDLMAVYDLGGGTFDAAVLRRTPVGFELAGDPEGVEHLGGLDFDDILFHLVRTRVGEPWNVAERRGGPSYAVAVANVRRECVAAKEALSVDTLVEVPVMLPGVSEVVRVTRNEFERLIGPSVADSIGAFHRTLRQANVAPSELGAVLLVGGSVALGAVRAAVRQAVGELTPILDGDPKYAVARGGALLAAWGQPATALHRNDGATSASASAATPSGRAEHAGASLGTGPPPSPALNWAPDPAPTPASAPAPAGRAAPGIAGPGSAPAAGALRLPPPGPGAMAAQMAPPGTAPPAGFGAPPGPGSAPGQSAAPGQGLGPGTAAVASGGSAGSSGLAGSGGSGRTGPAAAAGPGGSSGTDGSAGSGGTGGSGGTSEGVAERSGPAQGDQVAHRFASGTRGERAAFTPTAPKRSTRVPRLLVAVLAVVALGAAGVYAALRDGGPAEVVDATGTTSVDPADTTTGTDPDAQGANPAGGAQETEGLGVPAPGVPSADRMSTIPAGTYTVGLNPAGAESSGARQVRLDAFLVDSFEVQNRQYDAFVQQVGAPPATTWPGGKVPDAILDHPVRGVPWIWARAYCNALSKRLPTEAEWETAARGSKASLYPWGDNRSLVDIDTAGTRPTGSTTGNRSEFGVSDTVASVWEWVDEPYEPVTSGQQVRHGGENGRVRDGAAMRQAVEPGNLSAIAETGFRCAAEKVDPATVPLTFNLDLPMPKRAADFSESSPDRPENVLVNDLFEDRASGFREASGPDHAMGYYAPSWYHLEATGTGVQTVATGGYSFRDVIVETHVHVDGTLSAGGRVRYGLVVRASGDFRAPPNTGGPARVANFMAFTIDPRAGRWELLIEGDQALRVLQSGALPAGVRGFDRARPDALSVQNKGTVVTVSVNGTAVSTFDTGVIENSGDIGFFVETIDETFADVHFADLKVTAG
ncbi:MAG: SUMF1/EgtB/PvdO family nonheme iron enzyme [Acidimicrobiales bacterium]